MNLQIHFLLRFILTVSLFPCKTIQLQGSHSCIMNRSIHKSGFHRDLRTELRISLSVDDTLNEINLTDCEVMLLEDLPSGVYVDLYQAESVHAAGGPQVCSMGDIDLEKPEYESPPHKVFVYSSLVLAPDYKHADIQDGRLTLATNVSIEVHARYHQPSKEKDFITIEIPAPRIFIHCSKDVDTSRSMCIDSISTSDNAKDAGRVLMTSSCSRDESKNCSWSEISCSQPLTAESDTNSVQPVAAVSFDVPVGRMEELTLVTLGTFILTTAVALFLIWTVISKTKSYT